MATKPRSFSDRTELQRLLSKRGFASRTQAARLIIEGRVSVNGTVITDPHAYISIQATIHIEGHGVVSSFQTSRILVAFHKPRGVITTASDEKGRKTVFDVLPEKYHHLKPVGRLDMATSGLLLFTNDPVLANKLLDPKNKIPRTYIVTVEGSPSDEKIQRLQQGIIEKGVALTASHVEVKKRSGKESILVITLLEGKNREVRRMGMAIGHEVIKLKRISFGDIQLGELPIGETQVISIPELWM